MRSQKVRAVVAMVIGVMLFGVVGVSFAQEIHTAYAYLLAAEEALDDPRPTPLVLLERASARLSAAARREAMADAADEIERRYATVGAEYQQSVYAYVHIAYDALRGADLREYRDLRLTAGRLSATERAAHVTSVAGAVGRGAPPEGYEPERSGPSGAADGGSVAPGRSTGSSSAPSPPRTTGAAGDVRALVVGAPDGSERLVSLDSASEREVLRLTNRERAAQGLPALSWDEDLADAARYHAADMALTGYFDHDSHDKNGDTLVFVCNTWDRIRVFGSGGGAENIAAGQTTAASVVSSWMNSDGHRANILGGSTRLGVGMYRGSAGYGVYWVQVFGR